MSPAKTQCPVEKEESNPEPSKMEMCLFVTTTQNGFQNHANLLDVKKENSDNKKMSIEIYVLKEESMDVHCTVCDKPFANHRYMVQHRYQVH